MNKYYQSDYLTLREAAMGMRISDKTLRNKISRKESNLPSSFRIGRKRLFPTREYYEWIQKQRDKSTIPSLNNSNKDK
jgi:excisionase family DNA binding protein